MAKAKVAALASSPATAPANATRGESTITLEGISYVMRPSWEAIDEFETGTGKSAKELLDGAYGDRLKSREIAAVVGACVRAKGRQDGNTNVAAFQDDRIRQIICGEDGGLLVANRKLAVLLLMAVTGGVDSAGNEKARKTKSPSTPAAAPVGSQA